ncbi:MAG: DM13 domain-containing protein [Gammaproteobacteria bacterium]|nr:DM13 domain-containing protein [Gammaproteobacteria bacterium]NNF62007.1 DM13 domain-containing protein [Gammaproteobacteria bacterium]
MKKILLALALVIVAAAGWFFASPLFIDDVVDEAPIAVAAVPTREQVRKMPPEQRTVVMNELMASSAAKPDTVMDEPMNMAMAETPLVVALGNFTDADAIHRGSGKASMYRLPDGSHVLRFEDFAVTNGPALVVLMSSVAEVSSAEDVKAGRYIKLGKLKGNKGNQNYTIPASIDPSHYRSVVIWCDLFDVVFSPATLNAT